MPNIKLCLKLTDTHNTFDTDTDVNFRNIRIRISISVRAYIILYIYYIIPTRISQF